MNIQSRSTRKWTTRALFAGAVLGASALAVPRGARADDVSDALQKMKEQADCRSRCNDESLRCMARCPNGNPGASCRANCLMDSNSCANRCN